MQYFRTNPAILRAENLTIDRGDKRLVNALSLEIAPGDLLWVTGTNGIGKTSLLKCVAGLLRPAAGTLYWDETPFGKTESVYVGYQGHLDALKGELSVRDNLAFWNQCYGGRANIEHTLSKVGLKDQVDLYAKALSAGQSRRLALARLSIKSVPLWVLDEPAAALDKAGRDLVRTMIEGQINAGGAVIIASHANPERYHKNTRVLRFESPVL